MEGYPEGYTIELKWRAKLRIQWKYFLFWFNKNIRKVEYVSSKDFAKDCKSMSKNDIIRELVYTAASINKSDTIIPCGYKKELRKRSKKDLIKALTYLKIKNQFE